MRVTTLDVVVVAVYLAGMVSLGVYQAVKVRTSGDYFAGGRRFSKFYAVMHALGAGTHADEPVIVGGAAYRYGVSGIWYNYIYLLINPVFWLIAPFFRRSRFLTTADFFNARYGGGLSLLYSVMGVANLTVTMAMVLKGTGAIAAGVSGVPGAEFWAILSMTVVVVAYSFAGGLIATVVTNTVQGALEIVMSLLLIPFGLYAVGGFRGLHRSLDEHMFSLTATGEMKELTWTWVLATAGTALIGLVAQPGLMAVLGSGRTEMEGRVGYTYGTIIKRFCAMGWVFTGLIVAAMVAQGRVDAAELDGHRERAFGIAIRDLLPAGMVGLMAAAILASQMSTLSGQMVNASALAAHNVFRGVIHRRATDRQVLIVGRLCGLIVVTLGVLLAEAFLTVAQALTTMIQVQSLTGLLIWGGVLWRRANAAGAWAAFVVMLALWGAFGPLGLSVKAVLPAGVTPPAWLGAYARQIDVPDLMVRYVPAGLLALVAVSSLTRPLPPKRLDDFFLLLKTPVGQEQKLVDAGVPMVYAGQSQPNYWETHYPRLVHWGGFAVAAATCAAILGLLQLLVRVGS